VTGTVRSSMFVKCDKGEDTVALVVDQKKGSVSQKVQSRIARVLRGLLAMLALMVVVGLPLSCNEGPFEEAGEKADEAIEETQEGAEEAGDEARDAVEDAGEPTRGLED